MANEFKVKKGLIVYGSGSVVADIQGSQGQLMSVTDSLSGTLFSVRNISGLEYFMVSSSGDIKMSSIPQIAFPQNVITVNIADGKLSYTTASYFGSGGGPVSTTGFITTGSTAMPSQSISGSLTISGSAAIDGTIRHDLNLYGSLNFTAVNPSKNFFSFNTNNYNAAFLEYTLFFVADKTKGPTRTGNIRVEVPSDPTINPTVTDQANTSLPVYDGVTGRYINSDDVRFSAIWNGDNIDLLVYNNNLTYSAVIGIEYRLIKAKQ